MYVFITFHSVWGPRQGVIWYGCVTNFDCFDMSTDLFGVKDGLLFWDLDGAKPCVGSMRSQALRTGPNALGGVGTSTLYHVVDQPLLFSLCPIDVLCRNGIVLGGQTVEKKWHGGGAKYVQDSFYKCLLE